MAKKYITIGVSVPADEAPEWKVKIQRLVYAADPVTSKIMKAVLDNENKTVGEIRWLLQKKHDIKKSHERIQNIAKRIGVELKK